MSLKILLSVLLLIILRGLIPAQDTIRLELGGQPVIAIIGNGDTVFAPTSEMPAAMIQPPVKRKAETRDLRQYRRLVYNVKKVYPYAKIAGNKYSQVVQHLDSLESRKDQRDYIRSVEDEILKDYEGDLKDLTVTQGRILIKLIDRETSFTSYEVVKELRGGLQAAFWQAIARIFGSNLKDEFDADGEDKVINEIMILIEQGQL